VVINTNVPSLNAHRNLKTVGLKQTRAGQRLSSGFRINTAADDAAGLAISEKMRAQIRGLNQASRNAQDGISLIQTAEGAISSINEMVIRLRELVVQAANDTYIHSDVNLSRSDRAKIQAEINQIVQEINSVALRTEFNTMPLLDGRFSRGNTASISLLQPISSSLFNPESSPATSGSSPATNTLSTPAPVAIQPPPAHTINAANIAEGMAGVWSFNSVTGALTIYGNADAIQVDGAGMQAAGLNWIVVDGDLTGPGGGLILNNVNLRGGFDAALDIRNSEVDLWLVGTNNRVESTGNAGLRAVSGSTLRINGTGALYAVGGDGGAGIGGEFFFDAGTIYIHGGTVAARGCWDAAGIGGGFFGDGGNITITGGTITASSAFHPVSGASFGAGIGGGLGQDGGNITITGGTIAASGNFGAGIGGGDGGAAGNISISGGTITASVVSPDGIGQTAAGIGGGVRGNGGTIAITGGTVTASSEGNGAAIGGGGHSPPGNGANLRIEGGLLRIPSGQRIGGGEGSANHGTANITGGNIIFDPIVQIDSPISPSSPLHVNVSFNRSGPPLNNTDISLNIGGTLNPDGTISSGGTFYNALISPTGELFLVLPDSSVDDIVTLDIDGRSFRGKVLADGTLTLTEFLALEDRDITGTPRVGEVLTATLVPPDAFPVPEFRWYSVDLDEVARLEAIASEAEIDYGTGSPEHLSALADLEIAEHGEEIGTGRNLILSTAEQGHNIILRVSQDDGLGGTIIFPDIYVGPVEEAEENGRPGNGGNGGNGNGLWFQIGANSGQGVILHIEAMDAVTLGLIDVDTGEIVINVLHESGADISPLLNVLDAALSHASGQRAVLGAMQNRLEFTIRSLDISSENLSASESRIRDADMAREMMRFTQANVLQQAATAMLAQANQLPTAILQLLN
jgi:flagellin